MRPVLIKQPAGLGDIFFCQKIAKLLVGKQHKVIWPLLPYFTYLRGYLHSEGIEYPSIESDFLYKNRYLETPVYGIESHPEIIVVNLQRASHFIPSDNGVMYPKYQLVNLPFDDWATYFTFDRCYEREQKILDFYKIKTGARFIFVNKNFASPPHIETNTNIKPQTDIKIVNMEYLEWSNIFDWCGILERAEEIHTVETSICYLVEKLNTTNKLFLYPRNCETDFSYIKQIYKKPWKFMI